MGSVASVRQDSYESLIVWQKAMDLVDGVYEASDRWPKREVFGMIDQVRRAVVSIPSNIAEGKGRTGVREYAHHLSIASGSLCEVETLLKIALRRRYADDATLLPLLNLSTEVHRLLKGLIRSLR